MKSFVISAIYAGIMLCPGPVAAASLSAGFNIVALSTTCGASGPGSGSLSQASSGCSDTLNSGSFGVSGSGAASFDTLRASAGIGFAAVDPSGFIGEGSILGSARGQARYDDRLIIDIPGRTGEIVELVFQTALGGSMSASADDFTYAQADASLQVLVNGYRVVVSRNAQSRGDNAFNDFNPGRVQIELGSPFPVSAQLQVNARLQRELDTAGVRFFSGDALADFSNSAGIASFALFEPGEEGALIPDWSLSSESGQFGFYTVIPLPGAAWLFLTGLLTLACRLRYRKLQRG